MSTATCAVSLGPPLRSPAHRARRRDGRRRHPQGDRPGRVPGRDRSSAQPRPPRRAALAGRRPVPGPLGPRRTLSTLNSALGGRGTAHRARVARSRAGRGRPRRPRVPSAARGRRSRVAAAARRRSPTGEFLSGFVLRDSAEFDDWQLQAADELKREVGDVLERLSVRCARDRSGRRARVRAGVGRARRAARARAPRADARVRAQGRPVVGARQYRTCVAALERGLGVEPLEETTELYESIRENRDDVVALAAAAHAAAVRPCGARRCRSSDETSSSTTLQRAFTSSGTDGRLIVIGGEPGIGKTRLAAELLERVRRLDGAGRRGDVPSRGAADGVRDGRRDPARRSRASGSTPLRTTRWSRRHGSFPTRA